MKRRVFSGWTVDGGNITLADSTASTTTFTMPDNAMEITANYKDIDSSSTTTGSGSKTSPATGDSLPIWLFMVALASGTGTICFYKKKRV